MATCSNDARTFCLPDEQMICVTILFCSQDSDFKNVFTCFSEENNISILHIICKPIESSYKRTNVNHAI